MNMKKFGRAGLALLLSFGLVACNAAGGPSTSQESQNNDSSKLNIATSFYPMYEFTKAIAGETANVTNIMPAGSASHGWEPSAKQVAELSKADLLIYQGAGMEEWIESVKSSLENEGSKLKWVEAGEGIELLPGHSHDHDHDDHDHEGEHDHDHEEHDHEGHDHEEHEHEDHDHEHDEHEHDHADHEDHEHNHDDHEEHDHSHTYDPHLWLSPRNSSKMLENIKNALVELNPEAKDIYEKNFNDYNMKLKELDTLYMEKLSENNVKSFVITHEAFGYIAKDYGLKQYGLTGMGTEQDPNPEKMKEMVNLVKSENMKAIYYDNAGSDKIAKVLANELGDIEVLPLTTMHSPTEAELAAGETYFTKMEKNLENLCVNNKSK